ncbi:hypothetical protein AB0B45_15280 [Nonomuraea sp. NPDC049152]|uniref:hypothetical protein n=1 Tax=Nonomuraea sp. NPDC049152 TaxID=3154350 RepID=UPI0034025B05
MSDILFAVHMKDAASRLQVAAICWRAGLGSSPQVVAAACDALVAGLDTPALRILAGLRDPGYELHDHLPPAMRELHLQQHADVAWAIATKILTGAVTPGEGTFMATSSIGSEHPLAQLDREYVMIEAGFGTGEKTDRKVRAVAQRLIDSTSDPLAELLPYLALWDDLGELFAEDDGSLPEVHLDEVSELGAAAIWRHLLTHAGPLDDHWVVYSAAFDSNVLVNQQADLVSQIFAGRLEAFHVVLTKVRFDDLPIPDLGVAIGPGNISLDYRMGEGWNPITLGAFAHLLGDLRALDPCCQITFRWGFPCAPAIDDFLRDSAPGQGDGLVEGGAADGLDSHP